MEHLDWLSVITCRCFDDYRARLGVTLKSLYPFSFILFLFITSTTSFGEHQLKAPKPQPFTISQVTRGENLQESEVFSLDSEVILKGEKDIEHKEVPFELPPKFNDKEFNLAVSASVRSTGRNAYISLTAANGESTNSALYVGKGDWEVITVLAPKRQNFSKVVIGLFADKEGAQFKDLKLLVYADERFSNVIDETTDNPFIKFKENVFRTKKRLRIGVIGNSTVAGQQLEPYHSIPHLLQLKLETYYPGTFEVMNLGRNASTLLNQIIQFYLDCNFQHFMYPGGRERSFVEFSDFVKECEKNNGQAKYSTWPELKLDYYILGSMWNDTYELNGYIRPELYYQVKRKLPQHLIYFSSLFSHLEYGEKDFTKDLTPLNLKKVSDDLERVWYTKRVFSLLLRKFIKLVRDRKEDIALFTLPEVTGNRQDIKKLYDPLNPDIGFISVNEAIQNEVSQKVATKTHVPYVNVPKRYHTLLHVWKLTPKQLDLLGYFLSPIGGDLIHLSARGNSFAADTLFNELRFTFDNLKFKVP